MDVMTEKLQCSSCVYFIPYESMHGQIGECRRSELSASVGESISTRWTKVTSNHFCEQYRQL